MGDTDKTDHALTGGSLSKPQHTPAESGIDEGPGAYDGGGSGSAQATTERDHPDTTGRGHAGGNG